MVMTGGQMRSGSDGCEPVSTPNLFNVRVKFKTRVNDENEQITEANRKRFYIWSL